MEADFLEIRKSIPLSGEVKVSGAKNSALVVIISLLLVNGKSLIKNVPAITDVLKVIEILKGLGAKVSFDEKKKTVEVDTSSVDRNKALCERMGLIRASVLVAGPLLARFQTVCVPVPGGCDLALKGRPVNYHLRGFEQLGATIVRQNGFFEVVFKKGRKSKKRKVVFDYPSVGATENILMCAAAMQGETLIVNAALEPEVLDLISVLKKMGALVEVVSHGMIKVVGCNNLKPVEHTLIPDRLEAGSLLLAIAATGGEGGVLNARPNHLELFIEKLRCMGHEVETGINNKGIWINASERPKAIDIKTMPYPGFPTDLQAQMTVALLKSKGVSLICETVFDGRFGHVKELKKFGAKIVISGSSLKIEGGAGLYGADVYSPNIRAAYALVIAGLISNGTTRVFGLNHLRRGYDSFEEKLLSLGANVKTVSVSKFDTETVARSNPSFG